MYSRIILQVLSDRTGSALPTTTGHELALPNEAISPLLASLA